MMIKTKTSNGLEYLKIGAPPFKNITHGFFTRNGGTSPEPYNSLNLSVSTGDTHENVFENRKRIFEAISKPASSIFDVWQIHSDRIICTKEPRTPGQELKQSDAIFTDNPDVTLLMKFADCVPIFIYDPIKNVVGIIHAGWQGSVKQIAKKSIHMVVNEYGCDPADIHAVIGPSIGPDHYIVGASVHKIAADIFKNDDDVVFIKNGSYYFNLWKANELLLREAGVRHVRQTNICTACDTENWYSHRVEEGKTGRFAAVISLKGFDFE